MINKKLHLNKFMGLIPIFGVLIVGFLLYSTYYTPAQNNEKKIVDTGSEVEMLDLCLKSARTNYLNKYDSECYTLGLEKGCELPYQQSMNLFNDKKDLENTCIEIYPEAAKQKADTELNDCIESIERYNESVSEEFIQDESFCFKYYEYYKFR